MVDASLKTGVGRLDFVQHARGIASLMVLVSHTFLFVDSLHPLKANESVIDLGSFGVHVFFIISGFIMMYTCWDNFNDRDSFRTFAARRIVRVVPLYWVLTTVFGLMYFIGKMDDPEEQLKGYQVVGSYLFIPYDFNYDQMKFRPILGVGWSLSYEMLFYLVFGVALFWRRALGVLLILGVLVALVVLGSLFLFDSSIYMAFTRPVLLLFVLGIVLGLAKKRISGIFVPPALLYFIVSVVVVWICSGNRSPESSLLFQPDRWLAAFLIVAAAVFCTHRSRETMGHRIGLFFGDISYSMYLIHPIFFAIFYLISKKLHIERLSEVVIIAAISIIFTVISSYISYIVIERRCSAALLSRVQRRTLAIA